MANGFQGPPAVDFYSMLSGLGDTIAAKQAAAAKADAYKAALTPGPDGKVDFQKAILGLAQVDPHAASVLSSVQAHKDSVAQADRAFNYQQSRAKVEDDWADTLRNDSLKQHADAVAHQQAIDERLAHPVPAGYERVPGSPGVPQVPASGVFPAVPAVPPGQPHLAPMVGGPEDPETIRRQAEAKAKADRANPTFSTTPIYGQDTDPKSPTFGQSVILQAGHDGTLQRSKMPDGVGLPAGSSEDSLTTRATRYVDTGDESLVNRRSFGAGALGQAEFDKLQNKIDEIRRARGMRPDEISSNKIGYKASTAAAVTSARTRAQRETNLNMILDVTDSAVPAALELSKAIPRGQLVPLNKLIQKGQVMASNADLNDFGIANLQLAEGWARAMNPTGVMRESDRDKALHFLDVGLANGTYERGVKQIQKQILRERDSIRTGGHMADYDHRVINGGRPIKVDNPDDAAQYPSGTKILIPNGQGGFAPGVVP